MTGDVFEKSSNIRFTGHVVYDAEWGLPWKMTTVNAHAVGLLVALCIVVFR